jgi:tRNA threonylcarbamoyladenosine biosynthesis protein TsaB
MMVLGIETSTEQVSCALGGVEGVMASVQCGPGLPLPGRQRATPRHAEVLLPAIEFICEQGRVGLDEVRAVAVGTGPGMFTGVRVGVATGKSLAHALGVPMIAIESLDLVAFPRRHCSRLVATVMDARRGEVYASLYRPVPAGIERLWGPRLCGVDEVTAELVAAGERVLAVGTGAVLYQRELSRESGIEVDCDDAFPTAGALVNLAHPRAVREEYVRPVDVEPVYLRPATTAPPPPPRTPG